MMFSKTDFVDQMTDLYQHLYDLVHLRNHALVDVFCPDTSLRRKEKAWKVHHLLLDLIDELDPGPQAPVYSKEWRRHRLMVLRYVDGLDVQTVAQELTVSRRQYYREHEGAMQAIANIVWPRYVAPHLASQADATSDVLASPDHLELLRLEAARIAQTQRYVNVAEVMHGGLSLFQEMLRQQALALDLDLDDALPMISIDKGLLRQMFVSVLGNLVNRAKQATLHIRMRSKSAKIHVTMQIDPVSAVHPMAQEEMAERLSVIKEMGKLCRAEVYPIILNELVLGFDLELFVGLQRAVLVVDDNQDLLELFKRYLAGSPYHITTAQTAREGLALARNLQPYAITLDLMIPEQDGWELMQTLLNQPDTQHIPIIVCSVLKQKELALSLGATSFLEKPVSKPALLAALGALEEYGES